MFSIPTNVFDLMLFLGLEFSNSMQSLFYIVEGPPPPPYSFTIVFRCLSCLLFSLPFALEGLDTVFRVLIGVIPGVYFGDAFA
jgi:hypothetical protein